MLKPTLTVYGEQTSTPIRVPNAEFTLLEPTKTSLFGRYFCAVKLEMLWGPEAGDTVGMGQRSYGADGIPGRVKITLPAGAMVTKFLFEKDEGRMFPAVPLAKKKAKMVAEREKEKNRDVGLVSEVCGGGNIFEIEVSPLRWGKKATVQLVYMARGVSSGGVEHLPAGEVDPEKIRHLTVAFPVETTVTYKVISTPEVMGSRFVGGTPAATAGPVAAVAHVVDSNLAGANGEVSDKLFFAISLQGIDKSTNASSCDAVALVEGEGSRPTRYPAREFIHPEGPPQCENFVVLWDASASQDPTDPASGLEHVLQARYAQLRHLASQALQSGRVNFEVYTFGGVPPTPLAVCSRGLLAEQIYFKVSGDVEAAIAQLERVEYDGATDMTQLVPFLETLDSRKGEVRMDWGKVCVLLLLVQFIPLVPFPPKPSPPPPSNRRASVQPLSSATFKTASAEKCHRSR